VLKLFEKEVGVKNGRGDNRIEYRCYRLIGDKRTCRYKGRRLYRAKNNTWVGYTY